MKKIEAIQIITKLLDVYNYENNKGLKESLELMLDCTVLVMNLEAVYIATKGLDAQALLEVISAYLEGSEFNVKRERDTE